jgi:antirestriction protein ArdC
VRVIHRRGELSKDMMDWEWPHQVAQPAYRCMGHNYLTIHFFCDADSEHRTQDWYSVLTHELGHFTGDEKRLNRQFGKRFADSPYCTEELTAELCSAFLCAELGFTVQTRPDHAHYIGHWLRVMKADKRTVFTAAAAASATARYLHSQQA